MNVFEKLDALIETLEKSNFSARMASGSGAWGAQSKSKDQIKQEKKGPTGRSVKVFTEEEKAAFKPAKKEPMARSETLEKPPVSEAQRKAMHAAAAGNSTLGIPKSVGEDFSDADGGGKLPKKVKKGEKDEGSPEHEAKEKRLAEEVKDEAQELINMHKADGAKPPKTIDYSKINKPKAPEAAAPTINYSQGTPTRTPGATESGFKVPKEKTKVLTDPKFRTKLAEQRRAHGIKKSEAGEVSKVLTKSLRENFSDEHIGLMIKAAVDTGKAHRNILLEWQNFKTVSADLAEMVIDEE